MRRRCNDPGAANYPWYGAMGVRVCRRWSSFDNFLADMGHRPAGKTLDRKNPHGDYKKDNCRWANKETQTRNKRKT